jgi:hypothetical protein
MTITCYDETAAPGGSDRSNYSGGLAFQFAIAVSQYLRSVSIYQDSGTLDADSVEIWKVSGATRVFHTESPTWSGSRPGWRTWTLTNTQSSAVGPLLADTTYEIQVHIPSSGTHFREGCDAPAAPDPWSYEGAFFGSYGTLATSSSGTGRWGLSAGVDSALPGGGGTLPATGGTVSANLEDWLDSVTGTQPHSAPLETQTLASGSSGFAAIKGVVDTIATAVGSGLGSSLSAIGTTVDSINTALTSHISTWSADLAATLQSWNDGLVDWFNKMGGLAGGPTGALSGRTAFPTELWTMADTVDFTFQKSWDVPADLYTITLSGIPSRINTVDVDGATWRPRVGWWALRNGDLLGARRFLSWESEYVEDGGRRMPGIVVRTQPGITGTIEAWRLT